MGGASTAHSIIDKKGQAMALCPSLAKGRYWAYIGRWERLVGARVQIWPRAQGPRTSMWGLAECCAALLINRVGDDFWMFSLTL